MLTADILKFFDSLKAQIDQHHNEQIAFIDHYIEANNNPHHVTLEWDHSRIAWEEVEGKKGPYFLAAFQDNIDFRLLTRDLDANQGKLERNGWFYWQFPRSAKIGCKSIDGAP